MGEFGRYLRRALPADVASRIRSHLDECPRCWQAWNRYRWDAAIGTPLFDEFALFLGEALELYYDSSQALADEWRWADPATPQEVSSFYAKTSSYLYNQVIWHASGNRPEYIADALPVLEARSRVIVDYGCGIGEDTNALREHGFTVISCDYDSPPTAFLRWRQHRRGQVATVHQPDALDNVQRPDTLWMIDTADHIPDLRSTLAPILKQVHTVITENVERSCTHGRQGFHYHRTAIAIDGIFTCVPQQEADLDTDSRALTCRNR